MKTEINQNSEVLDYIYDKAGTIEFIVINGKTHEIRHLYMSLIRRLTISKILFNNLKYKN